MPSRPGKHRADVHAEPRQQMRACGLVTLEPAMHLVSLALEAEHGNLPQLDIDDPVLADSRPRVLRALDDQVAAAALGVLADDFHRQVRAFPVLRARPSLMLG